MGKRVNTAVWIEKQSRWQIKVQKDGVRKTFYSSKPGRTGQREANAKADAWLDDGIQSGNLRVEELFDAYADDLKKTTSQSNWRKIEWYGRVWLKPQIGAKRISRITEDDFQQLINKMYQKGLSKKTLLCFRAMISQFCKYCRRIKATTLSPEFLEIPKGAPTKPKAILQPEHLSVLFSSDQTTYRGKTVHDPLVYAYRFQVLTGLRPGELIGLRWDDITGDVVHIRRSVNVHGETTNGKNENAHRSFLLTKSAQSVLDDQRRNSLSFAGPVFPIRKEPYYYDRWKTYCRANNIPQITPYELRHTFVSMAKNLPEGQVKTLVGHSQNMDTLGTYSHEMHKDMERTADALESVIRDILAPNE